ncbi:hypothetical protein GTS_47240 [Gandjariella thermophila]|uniref:Transglycosylase SLT domain-containing protein n=1 Tax=Gandjariella thermophila TaxID=1931992 RepID=A0A4D4J8U9_9PSEU|nr:hypothetical protein GTS_47240 [Gandjariella thermophila]
MLVSTVPLLPAQSGTRAGLAAAGDPDPRAPEVRAAAPDPRGPYPLPQPPDPAQPGAPTSPIAAGSASGIPAPVLAAYQSADRAESFLQPRCHLRWWMLAGIGRVESNHAGGGRVDASGRTLTPILGPRLDGGNGFAAVPDTDGGALDGDRVWDRAVGPMQFIPGAWRRFGADGSGDGVADPNNVFDAAMSAARYLCDGGPDLNDPGQLAAAAYRYNPSAAYVQAVLLWMRLYAAGIAVAPVGTLAVAAADGRPAAPPGPAPAAEAAPPPPPAGDNRPPPRGSGGDRPGGNPPPGPAPLDPRCLADLRALGLDPVKLGLRTDAQCHDYLLTVGPLRIGGSPAATTGTGAPPPNTGKPAESGASGLLGTGQAQPG